MFHTLPQAEIPLYSMLATNGERSWGWIELGLRIPYFFASVRNVIGDAELERQLIFSRLEDVLNLAASQDKTLHLIELQLLSPEYMNGTNGYRLGRVREIWRGRKGHGSHLYVMEDGNKLRFDPEGSILDEAELEMVLTLDSAP